MPGGSLKDVAAIACLLLLLCAGPLRAADSPVAPAAPVDYVRDVRPIFQKHCYDCHGPEEREHGLRLDRKADALVGGDSGPALVAGKSAESLLVRYVSGLDPKIVMPPKGERLS